MLDALHTFRDSWYSANLMKAVISQQQAVAGAGAHGCGHLWPRAESSDQQAGNYRPGGHGCAKGIIIHYVPAMPRKVLRVEFRIDNNSDRFRSKTDELVTYLIGNRSPGTLSDWLQNRVWRKVSAPIPIRW